MNNQKNHELSKSAPCYFLSATFCARQRLWLHSDRIVAYLVWLGAWRDRSFGHLEQSKLDRRIFIA